MCVLYGIADLGINAITYFHASVEGVRDNQDNSYVMEVHRNGRTTHAKSKTKKIRTTHTQWEAIGMAGQPARKGKTNVLKSEINDRSLYH